MKTSKNYTIENINNTDYYMVNKKGVKYLVENNIRYMGSKNTDPILEDYNYPGTPTITDVLNFNDRKDFEDWLAQRAAHYTGDTPVQAKLNFKKKSALLTQLANEWMSKRDTSIYGDPRYLYESIHCGIYVSGEIHKTGSIGKWCEIDKLCKVFDLLKLKNKNLKIVDLGAGLGLTTIWMAYTMPNSTVYYLDASPESESIVGDMCARGGITNLKFIKSLGEIEGEIDVATGFEFVEHIEDPVEKGVGKPFLGIDSVLNKIKDNGIFMYSTMWNAEQNNGSTIGHFLTYDFDGKRLVMPAGKSDVRSRKHHRYFVEGMKKRNFHILNGGRRGTKWDFKGHTPYCFVKEVPKNDDSDNGVN